MNVIIINKGNNFKHRKNVKINIYRRTKNKNLDRKP